MPEFAVVIPTYRRPAFLTEAVESVLGQTHPPSEVIVVCDGPGEAVPDHLVRGPVRVVEQAHGGGAVARNTGIASSTSEWVCFLDDDDLWHPDRLRVAAEYLEANRDCLALTVSSSRFAAEPMEGIDFVADDLAGCLEAAATSEPLTDMSYLQIEGRSFDLLLERNRGNISGSTVRRDVLVRAGGFPAGFTCAEDWVMFINVARYTEWHFLDARLSFIRTHALNNTRANPTNGLVALRALRAVWDDRSRPSPPHRPLRGYGSIYRWTVQNAVWDAVRRRRLDIAGDSLREGLALLPRARDKAYALLPPPVTWRLERLARRATGPPDPEVGQP